MRKTHIFIISPVFIIYLALVIGHLLFIPSVHASTLGSSGTASTTLGNTLNTAGFNILGNGSVTGSMGAGYISTGIFGSNSTKGNYTFQAAANTNPILFVDATNERVGIGTTGPLDNLHVGANDATIRIGGNVNSYSTIRHDAVTTDDLIITNTRNAANADIVFSVGTEAVRIKNGGNVGVGTTDPQTILDSFSSSARGMAISNNYPLIGFNDTDGGKSFIGTQANIMYLWNGGTSDMIFATNNAEKMRILSTGNIGIGTTTPATQLTIAGTSPRTEFNQSGTPERWMIGTDTSPRGYYVAYDLARSASRIFVDTSGNVGIGTTGPRNGLEVSKLDSNYITSVRVGGQNQGTTGGGAGSEMSRNQILFSAWRDVVNNSTGAKIAAINYDRGSGLYDGQVTDLAFFVSDPSYASGDNTVERMRIKSGGNVGIGTTTPATALQVIGTVTATAFSGPITGNQSAAYISPGTFGSIAGYGNYYFNNTGGSSFVTVDATNSRVGIGTTAPNARLSLGTPVQDNALYVYDAANDKYGFGVRSSQFMIYSGASGVSTGGITFGKFDGTTFTEAMRVRNDGNVGIGTTGPRSKLDINGGMDLAYAASTLANGASSIRWQNGATVGSAFGFVVQNGVWFQGSNDGSNSDFGVRAKTADGSLGGTTFVVKDGGNVGIGTTGPSEKLHVVGNGIITGSLRVGTPNVGNGQLSIRGAGTTSATYSLEAANSAGATKFIVRDDGMSAFYGSDNAEKVRITETGNVGIGTTAPLDSLVVKTSTTGMGLTLQGADPIVGALTFGMTGSTWSDDKLAQITTSIDNGTLTTARRAGLKFKIKRSGDALGTLYEAMTIEPVNGNVGIGTTTPATALQVIGTVTATAFSGPITGNQSAAYISPAVFGDTAGKGNYTFQAAANTNPILFVDATNERVGIGTVSPQYPLDVVSSGNSFVSVGSAPISVGMYAGIHFGYRENNTSYRKSAIVFERTDNSGGGGNAAGKIHILNGPAIGSGSATLADARLTIGETGNVGIGTTAPGAKLHVYGTAVANMAGISSTALPTSGDELGVFTIKTNQGTGIWAQSIVSYAAAGKGLRVYNNGGAGETAFEVAQAGGSRLIVDGAGNVGIGTTAPAGRLQVGSASFPSPNATYNQQFIGLTNIMGRDTGEDSYIINNAYYSSTPNWRRTVAGGAGLIQFGSVEAGAIQFSNAVTGAAQSVPTWVDSMTIRASGFVGIGTTNPSVSLHTTGIFYATKLGGTNSTPAIQVRGSGGGPRIQTYGLDADSQAWMGLGTDMAGNSYEHSLYFSTGPTGQGRQTIGDYNGTTYNPRVTILATSGNVGIGTTGPATKLHIWGVGDEAVRIGDTEGTVGLSLGYDDAGTTNAYIQNRYANDASTMKFGFGTTMSAGTKMTILGNGNVGIGTTNPGAKLEVNGQVNINGAKNALATQAALAINSPADGGQDSTSNGGLRFEATGWGETRALMFNAYRKATQTPGTPNTYLFTTGNTAYSNNGSPYSYSAGALNFVSNGGTWEFRTSPAQADGAGANSDINWGTAKLSIDNSGNGVFAGTVTATAFSGPLTGNLNASYVTAGTFASGNFQFPSSLMIGSAAAPLSKLVLESTSENAIRFTNSTVVKAMVGVASSGGEISGDAVANDLVIRSGAAVHFTAGGSATKVIINSSGNVGIGTTGPNSKLSVMTAGTSGVPALGTNSNGFSIVRSSDGVVGMHFGYNTANGDGYIQQQRTDSAVAYNLLLQPVGGNVGIGTTGPGFLLDVNGASRFVGTLRFDSGTPLAFMNGGRTGNYNQTVIYAPQNDTSGSNINGIFIERGRLSDSSSAEVRYFTIGARGGQVQWSVDGSGNVVQSGNLTVNGGTITVAKLNADEVDPPYTIDGKKYATYMAGMTGLKEETTGVIVLKNGKAILDIVGAEENSDLWIFGKTINIHALSYQGEDGKIYKTSEDKILDGVVVLLTPNFDGRVWYEKKDGKILISSSEKTGEISYRLTAPRFDAAKKDGNRRTGDEVEGLNLDKLLK